MLASGQIEVIRIEEHQKRVLRTIGHNEAFSPFPLLFKVPCNASLIAKADCQAFSMPRETLTYIRQVMAIVARRTQEEALNRPDFFSILPQDQKEQLIDLFTPRLLEPGQVAYDARQPVKELCFVFKGTVDAVGDASGIISD